MPLPLPPLPRSTARVARSVAVGDTNWWPAYRRGIDYIKSDNCASYALDSSVRFAAMRGALNRTGRAIVLSIEPFAINPDPEQSYKVANLWRTGCDISGDWKNIINRADIADKWAPLAGRGGWNDVSKRRPQRVVLLQRI